MEHPFKLKEFNETEQKVKAVTESPPKIWKQHNNIEDESELMFNGSEDRGIVEPFALDNSVIDKEYEDMKKPDFSFQNIKVELAG